MTKEKLYKTFRIVKIEICTGKNTKINCNNAKIAFLKLLQYEQFLFDLQNHFDTIFKHKGRLCQLD